jgi:hypothetical protein
MKARARRKETEPLSFRIGRKLPSIFLHQVLQPHINIRSHAQSTCHFSLKREVLLLCRTHFWVLTFHHNCVSDGMKGRYFGIVEDNIKINCEV